MARLRWSACCLAFALLPYAGLTNVDSASAETPTPDGEVAVRERPLIPATPVTPESASLSSVDPPDSSEPPEDSASATPSEPSGQAQDPAQEENASPGAGDIAAEASADRPSRSLAGLIGQSEIEVLADVGGQFSAAISQYRLFDDELTSQVDETGLRESIDTGRGFSREVRAAEARTEQAKAQTWQSLGLLLPNIALRANRGYEISEPSVIVDPATEELLPYSRHIRTDVTLTATQPLFDLSAFMEWRRRAAKEEAREEGFRITDGDAYITTVNTYLGLVSTRLQADVMRDFEAQLAELLDYIEKRADAGAASVADMSRVRARSQATVSARLEQESAHLAAGTDFVRLTNLVPQTVRLPQPEDLGASLLPASFEQAVVQAMESNPEIASLNAELKSEKIDQTAAEGRFLPRFDAEYTDTYSDHAGGSDDSQRDKRIMLVMNWNLFSGAKDLNYLEERRARQRELRYRLDDERRRVVQALAANYAALSTTGERLSSGYEELDSISTAVNAMSKRMLSGNQSLLDLLDVYDRYFQVRSRLINLHVLEMSTVAQLIRLTYGTPWPSPEVHQQQDAEDNPGALPAPAPQGAG